MKKWLLFSWTIILVGIIFYMGWTYFFPNELSPRHKDFISKQKTTVFDKGHLDTLLSNNDYVLLTLGATGCSMCDIILSDRRLWEYPIPHYYIDKDYHNNNLLVVQALRNSGFPISYVIDKDFNIVGTIIGSKDLVEKLDGIVSDKTRRQNAGMKMLNHSFRALLSYFDGNLNDAYNHARLSANEGDYFFNNYMAYKYQSEGGTMDSVAYYKDMAIGSLEGADIFIYESLIREIDPGNESLQMVESHALHHHEHDEHDEHSGHHH